MRDLDESESSVFALAYFKATKTPLFGKPHHYRALCIMRRFEIIKEICCWIIKSDKFWTEQSKNKTDRQYAKQREFVTGGVVVATKECVGSNCRMD